jgi:hypothetical protein
MLSLPFKALAVLGLSGLWQSGSPGSAKFALDGPRAASFHPRIVESIRMSEQQQFELIRSYASSGFAAVSTINSGALIAGLS